MVLNPAITEKTYKEIFKLDSGSSFLTSFNDVTAFNFYNWIGKEALLYSPVQKGTEVANILPSSEQAKKRIKSHGILLGSWKWYHFLPPINVGIRPTLRLTRKWLLALLSKGNLKLSYPVVGGYSDIVIISSSSIDKFCLYAGCFAATNLFVEFAIPTSLLLSSDHVVCEKDLDYQGRALWTKDDFKILDKYENNLQALLDDFPSDYLYLHPIKLSKWK